MRRALDIIQHTTYRDERGLKFAEYAEKLQKAYLTLDKTTAKKPPQEQVRLFLENIRNDHPELVAAKREARHQFPSQLNEAIQHVSITVTLLYPPSTIGQRRTHGRAIGATETEREVQRARVAQQVAQLDGVHTLFGVDVTNVERNFTPEEFNRLGAEGRDYVFSQRQLQRRPNWRGRGRFLDTRSVASLESHIAKLESNNPPNADQVSVLTEPTQPTPKINKGSTNGSQFGAGAHRSGRSRETSLTGTWTKSGEVPRNERGGDRSVSRLTTVRRIAANQTRKDNTLGHAMPKTIARNEMDTLADTSCAGPNWALIELTGQVCNVTGFMDSG